MKRHTTGILLSFTLACAAVVTLLAQSVDVPVDVQLPLFSKILTYNRTMQARAGDRIVLGILYQHTFKGSAAVKDEMVKAIAESRDATLGGLPLTVELIDLASTADVGATLDARRVTVAYVAPLRAFDLDAIVDATRQRKILTLTGVSAYVERGVSIGIAMRDQRPQIIINLPSAKAEGADFNSHFLKLVRVFQ